MNRHFFAVFLPKKRCYALCFFDPRRLCERPFLTVFAVFSTYPKFSRERQSLEPKKPTQKRSLPKLCTQFGQRIGGKPTEKRCWPKSMVRFEASERQVGPQDVTSAPCKSPESRPERTQQWHLPPKIRPRLSPRSSWSPLSAFSWENMRRKADTKAILA